MIPVVGVYKSRIDAERGVLALRSSGVSDDNINILTTHPTPDELAHVPTIEGEQPGVVKAIGSVTGAAAGLGVGAGLAALLLPGVGLVLAIGSVGGLLLGALAGESLGSAAVSATFSDLPEDEFYIYEDALRQGRTVVVAMVVNKEMVYSARDIFTKTGAESIDRAREMWWLGLRDIESEHYKAQGGNFQMDEQDLQRGFEAAQQTGGKPYADCQPAASKRYPDTWNSAAFRHGYERGCRYFKEKRKP